jgi:two-component system cell cycle sensor histidine kinase/response regulator CckA
MVVQDFRVSCPTLHAWRGSRSGGTIAGYVGAVLGPAVLVPVKLWLPSLAAHPFLLALVPVALAAWLAGPWPAALATFLSSLAAAYYFIPPLGSFRMANPLPLTLFIFEAVTVIAVIVSLRHSRRLLGEGQDALHRTEEQLRQAQKMEAVGRLAGGVAHDFNNILAVILSYSDLLLDDLGPDDPSRADIQEIAAAGRRAAELTRQLLLFSRQEVLEPRVVDLNGLVAGMDKMLGRIVGEDVAVASMQGASLPTVLVDAGSIEQVIMNLVVNARDAMPSGGKLTIETSNTILDEAYARAHLGAKAGPHVLLAVSDTGIGMDEATRARIFEPFFTTKEKGKGTGLGLSVVFGIVKQSGGSIDVYSEPGKGTTFKVYLPVVAGAAHKVHSLGPRKIPGGSETILLVEDDVQVRAVAKAALARHGCRVLAASSVGEAVALCETYEGAIDLLLSDVVMPESSGPALAKRLAMLRPRMKILFMSGFTDEAVVRHGLLDGKNPFLQKPFTAETLTRKVRGVLDSAPPAAFRLAAGAA